jgi:hypothetical protein
MKRANDIALPRLMVHLLSGSRERANVLITFDRAGSTICCIVGVASSTVILFCILYTLSLIERVGLASSCSPNLSELGYSSTTWLSSRAMDITVATSPSRHAKCDHFETRLMKVMQEAVMKNERTSSFECLNT